MEYSQNDSGRIPVLDLGIWIEDNTVRHTFFKKQVSNEYTILARTALSEGTKVNTIFMEAYRRVINCDTSSSWSEIEDHLS